MTIIFNGDFFKVPILDLIMPESLKQFFAKKILYQYFSCFSVMDGYDCIGETGGFGWYH